MMAAARHAGATIVHSEPASRAADCADIVPALRAYVRAGGGVGGTWAAEPLAGLRGPGDLLVTKSCAGAFGGSDLDQVLRNLGVRTVLYAGVVIESHGHRPSFRRGHGSCTPRFARTSSRALVPCDQELHILYFHSPSNTVG